MNFFFDNEDYLSGFLYLKHSNFSARKWDSNVREVNKRAYSELPNLITGLENAPDVTPISINGKIIGSRMNIMQVCEKVLDHDVWRTQINGLEPWN